MFMIVDGTWTAENSGIVLRNPVSPFNGGVVRLSDAPIPFVASPVDVSPPSDILVSSQIGKRRKRATIYVPISTASFCEQVFSSSNFARYLKLS